MQPSRTTRTSPLPEFLYHYYESACGPFRSLSDLTPEEAAVVQEQIRLEGRRFASRRTPDYLKIRRELETHIRDLFIAKGGRPQRERPHYMILGSCEWLKSWYVEGRAVRVPLNAFSPLAVSFTYGDSFPAMRFQDGRPYRGQVYMLNELPSLVAQYGLPQDWNAEGNFGPERYIEAQVWEIEPLRVYTLVELHNPIPLPLNPGEP
jgi:hypothetical protein